LKSFFRNNQDKAMTPLVAKALRLRTTDSDFESAFQKRLHWSAQTDADIETRVADILLDVQQRGDAAVLEYTHRFDGLKALDMQQLVLTQDELKAAFDSLPAVQKEALLEAAKRVRS
jgi:histidinol dehydrogenase